jgi:hypothetical protein
MNYIKHLTGFFDRVVQDHTLNPTHISLYISIFQFWNLSRFQNPISITRDEVMRISKICSKATYHKCMREMHEKGYLKYEPSYNPFRGSMVHLINFADDLKPVQKKNRKKPKIEQLIEQAMNKQQTSTGTATEQALVSSINYINNTNILNDINLLEQTQNSKNEKLEILKNEENTQKKLRQKKGKIPEEKIPPDWDEVNAFFLEKNFPDTEAQKFFNHFQSNGWLVGGKSKMKDWKAAARNWMLNATKFANNGKPAINNQPKPAHLHIATQKNYDEPL